MHNIGRTQLEQQPFAEYHDGELAGGPFESGEFGELERSEREEFEASGFGEYEGAEAEVGEFGGSEFGGSEFGGSEYAGASPGPEGPFSELQEMELASELLEVTSEQELEQFLFGLIGKAGHAGANFLRSDTGRALGGILKNSLRSMAKQALPVVGRAIGDRAGGRGDAGARAGADLGALLGLELEGLSPEDREFEIARQLTRFAGAAAQLAAAAPPDIPPAQAAQIATRRAAQIYAPGFLPRLEGRSTQLWPRAGRWVRRGQTIVLFGS